ncbi:hypothetical protein RHSIM_Rhsim01G0011900 [Rhododendron simsii]|uniref:Reverse transcriptase domain-containing protein n=1 Tax=Rhododendron simsii TaxID=118357 RepID=A0A834LTW8_RHOSS|nr:hypothetical protein RHSIM_Rhsim01G0011900 [Rhododendron simsii]
MNRLLTRPISHKEVKGAVFGMDPGRAPRPDGMGAGFLQKFWDVVGPNIVDAIRSYCHSVYKVMSKVFVNRLQRFLPEIISDSQCAFVRGRVISDNTILVQEVLHYMKNCRYGNNRSVALKLDMSKAYDRVEWGFMEAIMRKMGFDEIWIKWIMDAYHR